MKDNLKTQNANVKSTWQMLKLFKSESTSGGFRFEF